MTIRHSFFVLATGSHAFRSQLPSLTYFLALIRQYSSNMTDANILIGWNPRSRMVSNILHKHPWIPGWIVEIALLHHYGLSYVDAQPLFYEIGYSLRPPVVHGRIRSIYRHITCRFHSHSDEILIRLILCRQLYAHITICYQLTDRRTSRCDVMMQ